MLLVRGLLSRYVILTLYLVKKTIWERKNHYEQRHRIGTERTDLAVTISHSVCLCRKVITSDGLKSVIITMTPLHSWTPLPSVPGIRGDS